MLHQLSAPTYPHGPALRGSAFNDLGFLHTRGPQRAAEKAVDDVSLACAVGLLRRDVVAGAFVSALADYALSRAVQNTRSNL